LLSWDQDHRGILIEGDRHILRSEHGGSNMTSSHNRVN
jgi:hypothetical protein